MKALKTFVSAVLAGMCVGFGGVVFLSLDNRIIGSVMFTVGLFTICTFGLHLFTGKVCYLLDNGPGYLWDLALIWLGNLGGTLIATALLGLTRVHPALAETAAPLVAAKLGDGLLSVFVLSVFCNVLIFIAVDGYRIIPDALGKYLALFLGVAVFAISGFEHCVANMYFISLTGSWSADAVLFIIVNTVGNSLGGLLVPAVKKIFK